MALSRASTRFLETAFIKTFLVCRQSLTVNNTFRNFYLRNELLASISFNLSDIGEGIREVVVKEWFVKVGDKVSQFDNICEVQSDKASVTITSRYDGVITKLHHKVDDTAYVGQALIDINVPENENSPPKQELSANTSEKTEKAVVTKPPSSSHDDHLSLCIPSVRRLAKQEHVDLSKVTGTGRNGRILKEDVLNYLQKLTTSSSVQRTGSSQDEISADKTVPLSAFAKGMVKSMQESLKIPHFGFCEEIAITNLSRIQESLKEEAKKENVKLTLLPFIIKAVSNSLHKFPILNASLDENLENIIYKKCHNIAVAMDTNAGLAAPVIKNVDKLNILQIAKEIARLSSSGKKGQFSKDDLIGGTFCVSNIGSLGGTYAHPIVLTPQVAIIAFGKARILPRFDSSNNVIAEKIMNLSGSADHRILDGATVVRFMNDLKEQLENPYLLLLQV